MAITTYQDPREEQMLDLMKEEVRERADFTQGVLSRYSSEHFEQLRFKKLSEEKGIIFVISEDGEDCEHNFGEQRTTEFLELPKFWTAVHLDCMLAGSQGETLENWLKSDEGQVCVCQEHDFTESFKFSMESVKYQASLILIKEAQYDKQCME